MTSEGNLDLHACFYNLVIKISKIGNTVFLQALFILTLAFVLFQIEKGAKLNARDFYGNSPLHVACRVGDLSVVTHLLKNNANVNARNYIG